MVAIKIWRGAFFLGKEEYPRLCADNGNLVKQILAIKASKLLRVYFHSSQPN